MAAPSLTYTQAAGGDCHSLLLRSDGQVVAFGKKDQGQCEVPALPSLSPGVADGTKLMTASMSVGKLRDAGRKTLEQLEEQCRKLSLENSDLKERFKEQTKQLETAQQKITELTKLVVPLPERWIQKWVDLQEWAVHKVSTEELDIIREMFKVTMPDELGIGRDAQKYDKKYNNLAVHCAWRVENKLLYKRYIAECGLIQKQMRMAAQ